jgi:transcriptional regulator with XRE-family HTH domain
MSSPKLGRYLRAYRKGSALTARDIAALLGFESGGIISRAEMGHGIPSVPVLLGYSILFNAHPKDLVPGIYNLMERMVQSRAKFLAGELKKRRPTSLIQARIKFLENLSQPYGEAEAIRKYEHHNPNGIPQAGASH